MLTILGKPRSACDRWSRRELLTAGGAGLLGLSLPRVLRAESAGAENLPQVRAKSVIFALLFGGPSQLETFDMKPDAPAEIRGPFRPMGCRTPGLAICEHLPELAKISDKYCVIRTMTHNFNDHSGGGHYIQTGKRWHIPIGGGFDATPRDWPSIGSVVEYMTQREPDGLRRTMPNYAVVPNWLGRLEQSGQYRRPGQYAGWLGHAYDPLTTSVNKRDASDNPYWRECTDDELTYQIDGLERAISIDTLQRRAGILQQYDAARRGVTQESTANFDRFRQRALALVTSDSAREALDIRRESAQLRDRYGRHLFGQSCLMARRLVEAGVRFVTVHYECVDGYSWDSHVHSDDVRHHLLPTFDQGLSALLTDLDERGLLAETLVVVLGEMGRTPRANSRWGRDHWSTLFPAVLAGAGVQRGSTYGRSDRTAAFPAEDPVSPEDLAATIYWGLGIDPGLALPDSLGRPVRIVEHGQPLTSLFA